MSRPRSKARTWLIFAGIVLLVLGASMLSKMLLVMAARAAMPMLILGGALLLLAWLAPRKRKDKTEQ